MRDPQAPAGPASEVVRLMPARAENARALYVINLTSSDTPMPLEMPDVRGFFGLAVFRSRRIEDGRDRFRLHLGYFESRADAERALPAVQRRYPTAWIAAAPRSGLGSLDDTNVSEFRLIHTPASAAQPDLAAAPAATTPSEIPVAAPQRYVVQLVWSDQRVDPSQIPQLAIYDAYTMYTVTVLRGGVRYYGIRLGFFTSVISARQIALYVRPDFPGVAVVPVSSREYDVARTIAWHRDSRTAIGPDVRSDPLRLTLEGHVPPAPTTTSATADYMPEPPAQPAAATAAAEEREDSEAPAPSARPLTSIAAEPSSSVLDPIRIVAATLVQTQPTAPPVEAPEAAKTEPIVVPELSGDPPRALASGTKSATMKMREESERRGPAFSREELMAALNATEASADERCEPRSNLDETYSPPAIPKRESAIRRLWHRLMG